jgi:hypothetical protein
MARSGTVALVSPETCDRAQLHTRRRAFLLTHGVMPPVCLALTSRCDGPCARVCNGQFTRLKLVVVSWWHSPNRPRVVHRRARDSSMEQLSRGRRSDSWTAEEDAYIAAHYPKADKWTMLQALPRRSWNMIYQRALGLGVRRATSTQEDVPLNICIEDLEVIPDPDLAMALVLKASKRRERSGKLDPEQGSSQMATFPVWLRPANNSKMAVEGAHRTLHRGD